MSLAALKQAPAFQETETATRNEGQLNAETRLSIRKMRDYCEQNNRHAKMIAQGFVVDSTEDLVQQINDHFPNIHVEPLIHAVKDFIADSIQKTNQRYQLVRFHYVADGKEPPLIEGANRNVFIKLFDDNVSRSSGFTDLNKDLKLAGGASAGGDPNEMLQYLSQGLRKFFVLDVSATDSKNERDAFLQAQATAMQAFPGATAQAADMIAAGGSAGAPIQAVAEQIIDTKALRQSLTNTNDTGTAAALAIKVETLAATLPTLQATPQIQADVSRVIETVRTDLNARQIAHAVEMIMAPAVVQHVPQQVAQVMQQVQTFAAEQQMPVQQVIALTMTQQMPTPEPVRQMVMEMSKPEFIPSLPATIAEPVRIALAEPAVQQAAQQPVPPAEIVQQIQEMAQKAPEPIVQNTLQAVAQALAAPQPMQQAPMLENAVLNLKALTLSETITTPPALNEVIAKVETMAIQAREPAPAPAQQPVLPDQAPIVQIAKAVDVPPPETMPPAPHRVEIAAANENTAPEKNITDSFNLRKAEKRDEVVDRKDHGWSERRQDTDHRVIPINRNDNNWKVDTSSWGNNDTVTKKSWSPSTPADSDSTSFATPDKKAEPTKKDEKTADTAKTGKTDTAGTEAAKPAEQAKKGGPCSSCFNQSACGTKACPINAAVDRMMAAPSYSPS